MTISNADFHGGAHDPAPQRRVLVLGDSWVRGLGPERRRAFGKRIAAGLDATQVLNLSAISRTAGDVVDDHLDEIRDFKPHVAVLSIGGAESLIFPAWPIQRLIDRYAPPQWHGVEGMMPLAQFSRNKKRRRRQIFENVIRIVLKQLIINLFGGRRRVSLPDLEAAARTLMSQLHQLGTLMIVIGLGSVDPFLSPKTNQSVKATNDVLARLCDEFPGALFVPTVPLLHRWRDYLADHVHLNAQGHQHLADGVLAAVVKQHEPWPAIGVEMSA